MPDALGEDRSPKPRRSRSTIVYISIGIAALLVSIILPIMQRYRATYTRVRCPSQLRQIGQALLLYEHEHKSAFPPDFETLYLADYLVPEVFVCRSSGDTKAEGTREQIASRLNGPPHCSFIYRGAGLHYARSEYIVAYEPVSNHHGDGSYALRLDGSVVFLTPTELEAALRVPATGPATPQHASAE